MNKIEEIKLLIPREDVSLDDAVGYITKLCGAIALAIPVIEATMELQAAEGRLYEKSAGLFVSDEAWKRYQETESALAKALTPWQEKEEDDKG